MLPARLRDDMDASPLLIGPGEPAPPEVVDLGALREAIRSERKLRLRYRDVDDPEASAAFYADLFGRAPASASPIFTLFMFETGLRLGLWARRSAASSAGAPGGGEVGIAAAKPEEVDATYAVWRERGVEILQPPTDMDFGRTFLAADPDGHRIRVFAVAQDG